MPRRNFFTNIKLLIFSLLFSLVIAEALVRFQDEIGDLLVYLNLKMSDKASDLRRPDIYLHHTLKTNVSVLSKWGSRKVIYHTNSLGFRDKSKREVYKKTKSQFRILFLGDSFTESVGIEYEDSFINKLELLLRKNGMEVEILNAGVVSLSPSLEYRKLKHYFDTGFTTDKVILMLDISDIYDEGVVYPDWEKQYLKALSDGSPFTNNLIMYSGGLIEFDNSKKNGPGKLNLRPQLITFLQDRLSRINFKDTDENNIKINDVAGVRETPFPRLQWTESESLFQDWGKSGVKMSKEYILKISKLCRQNDIDFSLVIYPWPTQLLSKRKPSKQQAIFSKFAMDNGIVFYDLFEDFFKADNWQNYYIRGDSHWNEKGHSYVANMLYNRLLPTMDK